MTALRALMMKQERLLSTIVAMFMLPEGVLARVFCVIIPQ